MKSVLNKINCFLLCFCLIFTIVITDYKKVSAMDWVLTQVTTEVALPFLMGLLGVCYVSTDGQMNSKVNEDEFLSYAEQQNIPGVNVREWLENVCKGTLNQASEVWTCFKNWVKNLTETSVTVTGNDIMTALNSIDASLSNCTFLYDGVTPAQVQSFEFTQGFYSVPSSGTSANQVTVIEFYPSEFEFTSVSNRFTFSRVAEPNMSIRVSHSVTNNTLTFTSNTGSVARSVNPNAGINYYFFGVSSLFTAAYYHLVDLDLPQVITNDFDTVVGNLTDLDLLDDDATSTSIPGVLPLPWDQVGTSDTAISDTLAGLIEQVQEGVLSIDDYIATLQDLIGVITVDTTSDVVIPIEQDPTTGEDITSDDIVNENISNAGFVLGGLEKVFPFCLPYDLYNFVTILVAEPVAPVINFPIYNPANGQTEYIEIDFSEWQSVVTLFRYIFDFLFIIGLILISRALIGGGDKA